MRFKIKRLRFISLTPKRIKLFVFLILLILALLVNSMIYNSIVPENAYELLKFEVQSHMDTAVDGAVNAYTGGLDDSLFSPTYDGHGNLISYSTDAVELERIESDISGEIKKRLKKDSAIRLKLPIGTLSDNKYLSGKGFKVTITSETVPSVTTSVVTEVTDSGINQTLYRIKLCTNVTCCVIYSGRSEEVSYSTEHILAERIIIGKVPLTGSIEG